VVVLILSAVNNAGTGIAPPTDTLSQTPDKLMDIFSVNVFGAIYMVQAVMPHIRPGGRIINISSVSQKVGMIAVPIYSATKAALDSLAFTWAGEVHISHPYPFTRELN
jgi:NAD(P)-dependent dehydrogenase (short-subunit alcohol dehydrogenase family)